MSVSLKNLYNVKLINRFLLFIFIFIFVSLNYTSNLLAAENYDGSDTYDFDRSAQKFINQLSLRPEEQILAQYKPTYDKNTSIIKEHDLFNLLSSSNIKEFVVHLGYPSPYLYPSYVIHDIRDLINKHHSDSVHLVYLSSYDKIDENFSSLFIQALHGISPHPSQRFIGIISKVQLESLSEDARSKIFSLFDHILVQNSTNNTLHYSILGKALEIAAANPNNLSTTVYLKEGDMKELSGIINSLVRLSYSDYTIHHNIHYVLQTGFNPVLQPEVTPPTRAASMMVANLDKISSITENASFTILYHEEPSYFSLFYEIINNKLYPQININNTLKKTSLVDRLLVLNTDIFKEIEVNDHKNTHVLKKITNDLNAGTLHYGNESARLFIPGTGSGLLLLRMQDEFTHKLFVQIMFPKVLESWILFSDKTPMILNVNGTMLGVPYENLKEISSDFLSVSTTLDITHLGIAPTESLRISAMLNVLSTEKETSMNSTTKLILKCSLSDQNPVLKAHSDIVSYFINKSYYFRFLEIQDQLLLDTKFGFPVLLEPRTEDEADSYIYHFKYNPNAKFPLRMKDKIFETQQSLNEYLTVSTSYLYNEANSLINKIDSKLNPTSPIDKEVAGFLSKRNCSDFFRQ